MALRLSIGLGRMSEASDRPGKDPSRSKKKGTVRPYDPAMSPGEGSVTLGPGDGPRRAQLGEVDGSQASGGAMVIRTLFWS